eukprot:CAMPEP_0198214492 /NCGR_PEP_ID=MMETSP1445-20131203/42006_1 /TAXON_ID=36898 /ORGANISM="Pyramimonas sp., Strain CCMP2087" /LENGTH=121 /DNA_ID=CAMNT_0043889737 /DNA_START=171 /DNA_END=532 /DNA_ORIENTATION=-
MCRRLREEQHVTWFQCGVVHELLVLFVRFHPVRTREVALVAAGQNAEPAVALRHGGEHQTRGNQRVVHRTVVAGVGEIVIPAAVVAGGPPVEHEPVRACRLRDQDRQVVHPIAAAAELVVV